MRADQFLYVFYVLQYVNGHAVIVTSVSVMSTSGGSGIADGFSGSADSESADAGASWVNSGPCCNMEVIFLWFVSITRTFFFWGIVRYGEKPVIFRKIKIESNFTPKRK